ncbi:GMC oxidoreductase [Haloplanus aerogenes]|uniref:Choline dehydrogenase-like flavoprotein n=1 Tax=Haloplanus aerogenes TaxID=660522 RepID=A0A3M0CY44_9EURY|nr:GMC family oxidoreductase [Haloplanus aerogenes]AZH26927.1 GMC family oxidoreductase [Haloplanus aerogenes]RMB12579.1 choline dehydrogenase-like flavoprotein [Haloplanus aerogenes]
MVADDYDVIVVGAGGDGPVAAWKLADAGLSVLVLEAGPFYGNEKWPKPSEEPGGAVSSSVADLSGELLDEQFTTREFEMVNKLLFGPADHERGFWFRKFPGDGAILQCAGVGGTTLHYTGCHPRAYPASIDEQGHWPIDYADLLPYYWEIETMCEVTPAPVTAKEELFFRGAAAAGWPLLHDHNVTEPGYRPQPNAIRQPDPKLHVDAGYDGDFTYPEVQGDTLALGNIAGNPHPRGAPYEEKAKRSSNVSFVPAALATGNVSIRPNAFVTDIRTETPLGDTPSVTGVRFRDTWSGRTERVDAEVVILAAGAIETPRLWLNADLPRNEWVGRGLTIHFGDNVMGLWKADDLEERLGKGTVDQHEGQDIAARFDYPGLGMLQTVGTTPGVGAILGFGASASGFTFQNDPTDAPWDTMGRLAGPELKRLLAGYPRMLQILVVSDDRPHRRNGVTVTPGLADEHGPIPVVNYEPSEGDQKRRDELATIAADILREAGASHVHRSDSPPTALHVHSTMRMGEVLDEACEAHDVDRLFVADHSALSNGVGGANPTNTGQALAARTADKILERYF